MIDVYFFYTSINLGHDEDHLDDDEDVGDEDQDGGSVKSSSIFLFF